MANAKRKNLLKGVLLYMLNVLCLSPAMIYAGQNFSVDSYKVCLSLNNHTVSFLGSYRWFGAFLYKFYVTVFNHNPINNSTIDCIIFVLLVSAVVLSLTFILYEMLNKRNVLSYIAINLSVYISILNVWFCNILSFPECIFITTVGVVLCFSALIIFIKKPNIKGYILSSIMVILSTAVYQQFLFVFIIYVILICSFYLIKNEEKTFKSIISRYIKPVVLIIVSAVLYLFIGKGIQIVYNIEANDRVALSISNIIENCIYFIRNQHSYLKGRGFFDSEFLTICFLIVGFLWFALTLFEWKKNKNTLKTIVLWLSYATAYIAAYMPGILSTSHAARAMFALFSIFPLLTIGGLILSESKKIRIVLCIVLSAVLISNIVISINCEINLKKQNVEDKIWSLQVIETIDKYELTQQEVTQIFYCYDEHTDIAAYAESAVLHKSSLKSMLAYYSNRIFEVKEMGLEEKQKYFCNKEWTQTNTDEQMVFEGDTLYLCCY